MTSGLTEAPADISDKLCAPIAQCHQRDRTGQKNKKNIKHARLSAMVS